MQRKMLVLMALSCLAAGGAFAMGNKDFDALRSDLNELKNSQADVSDLPGIKADVADLKEAQAETISALGEISQKLDKMDADLKQQPAPAPPPAAAEEESMIIEAAAYTAGAGAYTAGAADYSPPERQPENQSSQSRLPRNIMLQAGEANYLSAAAVVHYMYGKSLGRTFFSMRDIAALIEAYEREAARENINHDIAIAQMWYATRELGNRALLNNCNYAGLSQEGVRWNGRFRWRDAGVQAHIQHLKGYASAEPLAGPEVDPRYGVLKSKNLLGTGKTLDALSKSWVPANPARYESNIKKILEDLYAHQDWYNFQSSPGNKEDAI